MDTVESLLTTRARGSPRAAKPVIIDAFLAAVRSLGDSTPSDRDLDVTRRFLAVLTEQTAVDHLKSVDEMLQQVPTEFQAATPTTGKSRRARRRAHTHVRGRYRCCTRLLRRWRWTR